MNTYLVYGLIGLGILLVATAIPGVKIIAELLLKNVFEFVFELLKHKGTFVVWFIKTLVGDHMKVFQHASMTRDAIDPTQKIRRQSEGYEN